MVKDSVLTSSKGGSKEGTAQTSSGGSTPIYEGPILVIVLLLLMAVGLFLRLRYALYTSPYIDEYTTMWVAKRTLVYGYPVFSTGAIYGQGILFTYLDAFMIWLFGFSELAARSPSLILGVLTIPTVYLVGKKMFSAHEGLLAAAMLTFAPQAVIWGGRSRNYALIQFIVLCAAFLFYKWAIAGDGDRYGWLFVITFVASVYTHNVAMLLYPAFLVCGFLSRGWRWFFQRKVIMANVLVFMGMASSLYVYRRMQPPGWGEVGQGRLEVGVSFNLWGAIQRYKPFFLGMDDLPFAAIVTVLCIAGVLYFLWRVAARRGFRSILAPSDRDSSLAYLTLFFVIVVLEMFFVVNERRWSPRYFFLEAPLFYLIGTNVLSRAVGFGERAVRGRGWLASGNWERRRGQAKLAGTVLAVLAVGLVSWAPATAVVAKGEYGYDRAFHYVLENRQPEDTVMTFAISPCALYLGDGGCDYVAIEKDFHSYATQEDGQWIEAWGGVPILFTDEPLMEVVESSPRTWFVVDESRFRTRYTERFIQYVWDRMELVAKEGGVFVFLAESPPPPPLAVQGALNYNLGDEVTLRGYGLSSTELEPGEVLSLSLRWQAQEHILHSYSAFVHLVDARGRMWAQHDGAPLNALHPTTHWVAGEIVSDHRELALPGDMPDGRYRLQVGMYLPETMEHLPVLGADGQVLGDSAILDYVTVQRGSPGLPVPEQAVSFSFDGRVSLSGYDLQPLTAGPGDNVSITLYWTAEGQVEEDYTVFVHLVDEEGTIWGQRDSEPEGGFYHTSFWDVGEIVADQHEFAVDQNAPPGEYRIEVGMYVLETGQRLPVVDEATQVADDKAVLGAVIVER